MRNDIDLFVLLQSVILSIKRVTRQCVSPMRKLFCLLVLEKQPAIENGCLLRFLFLNSLSRFALITYNEDYYHEILTDVPLAYVH